MLKVSHLQLYMIQLGEYNVASCTVLYVALH